MTPAWRRRRTFIKPAEVLKMMQDKDTSFVLVDTQPEEAFADGHIPGAINYPWVQRVRPPISLPRDKMLVLYCPCNHDEDSIDMYKKLAEFGYLNTKILEGGWYKWVALKYPVEGTDAANAIKEANAAAASGETGGAASSSSSQRACGSGRCGCRDHERPDHLGTPGGSGNAIAARDRRDRKVQGAGHLLRVRVRHRADRDRLLPEAQRSGGRHDREAQRPRAGE